MKKLNKVKINSEKIMKNEELITLRGGYGDNCCLCHSSNGGDLGYMKGATPTDCASLCASANFGAYGTWECLV
jgi:hypothetical protein